jgi:DNA replication and repair protein RecF
MRLASLKVSNFRSYQKRSFKFSEGTTLIVGDNASGKTNILEACFLLATGKSFRAQKIEEMILFDRELGRVEGEVVNKGKVPQQFDSSNAVNLELMLTRGEVQGKRVAKRRYSVDGAYKRYSDFIGRLVVVLFRPEDLQLILGSPSRRREHLDTVLSQVDREYRRSLTSYERALVRRNRILDAIRDEGAPKTQLSFWNQMLVKHGRVLSERRNEFLGFINSYSSEVDSFQVEYDSSAISEKRLEKYAKQEVAAGYTLIGPHKDDVVVRFEDGKELVAYGSRGEQRLAVLWLKLAELSFVYEKIGEKPVLLLDDIFSELDQEHRSMVLKVISKQQTVVTTTDLDLVESRYRRKFVLIKLS